MLKIYKHLAFEPLLSYETEVLYAITKLILLNRVFTNFPKSNKLLVCVLQD